MIGQSNLLQSIDKMIENNSFPRFSIIVGQEGSGKNLVVDYIGQKLHTQRVYMGTMVNNVRDMIDMAYTTSVPILFVLPDADAMSPQAKNALLKVAEEPPNNAYIILTLTDLANTLPTIKSRGIVLNMQPYERKEIEEYTQQVFPEVAENDEQMVYVADVCTTPGEVKALIETGLLKFQNYVQMVADNIAEVSGANAFKIASKVQLKEMTDSTKFPLKLFWRAFMMECVDRMNHNDGQMYEPSVYAEGIKITARYIQELRVLGINRQNLFDMWVLDVRKAWMTA